MSKTDNQVFQSLDMISTNENGEEINVYPYSKAMLIHFQDNKNLEEKIASIADIHTHNNATTSADGYMSKEDKTILNRVNGDSGYTHPVYHAATMITENDSKMFVTKAQKAEWSAKANTTVATTSTNGLLSKEDKSKLDQLWEWMNS